MVYASPLPRGVCHSFLWACCFSRRLGTSLEKEKESHQALKEDKEDAQEEEKGAAARCVKCHQVSLKIKKKKSMLKIC